MKARVERWAEDSGNAALAGRELPPAQVLAADQRVTWWARQLKKAGLAGDMDQLRARAFLDILLDVDSRPDWPGAAAADGARPAGTGPEDGPPKPADAGPGGGPDGPGGAGPGPAGQRGPGTRAPGGPGPGVIPPGFAGRGTLTVPLATLLDLAERPGEIGGIGPIDPGLARDLAAAAARNPRSTWCITVTDRDGHAIGHGCARPEPASHRKDRAKRGKPGAPDGHDPPGRTGGTGNRDGPPAEGQPADRGPGFAFTPRASPARPAGTGPGGCPPEHRGNPA